jgi:hypothetical protein
VITLVQNYVNYFTEIEEHFQRRRGSLLLLSTLDWALIETWREAGIPLTAVLRGIDNAFEKYEARKRGRTAARINGLAWCTQAVMEAAEQMAEAATGATSRSRTQAESELSSAQIADHLRTAAERLLAAPIAQDACSSIAQHLLRLADDAEGVHAHPEELETTLTALEEKLFAALLTAVPESRLIEWKQRAAHDLAAFRTRMSAAQMQLVQRQYLHKRLMEELDLQRLSLFYMRHR